MAGDGLKRLMLLLPQLPLMLRVTVSHLPGLSEQSRYLDLRSNLAVAVVRALIEPPPEGRSLEAGQKMSLNDPGVKGKVWVSTYTAPAPPETSVRDVVVDAVRAMALPQSSATASEPPHFSIPELRAVEAEWTGYRAGATNEDLPPAHLSPQQVYGEMMGECTQPTTVLYLHGGAYYLLDPATYRPLMMRLTKRTSGRAYSVRYRLAPQNPFPAALVDALVSYLTLLYPPPEAYHDPVKPEHIVFAGDSAGGGLSLALVQLLLHLQRTKTPVTWYGEERHVPLPSGVATNSPWVDITHSSPPWQGEDPCPWDYLAKPATLARAKRVESPSWPADPPRRNIYAEDGLERHPLVSPINAPSWRGCPPVWICTGWEMIGHEDRCLAHRLNRDGVPVVFEEYEAMPHCFAMLLSWTAVSRRCIDGWASFIRRAVEEPVSLVGAAAVEIKASSLEEVPMSIEDLRDPNDDEIWYTEQTASKL